VTGMAHFAALALAALVAGAAAAKTAYLGLWEGWMCRNKSYDIKLAVIRVEAETAAIVYAGASLDKAPHVERVTARFVGPALVTDLDDYRRLSLELRRDGHLNVKGEAVPYHDRWRVGVMNRMW